MFLPVAVLISGQRRCALMFLPVAVLVSGQRHRALQKRARAPERSYAPAVAVLISGQRRRALMCLPVAVLLSGQRRRATRCACPSLSVSWQSQTSKQVLAHQVEAGVASTWAADS